jgi:tetratricopeptide (TPR) repeat protein
MMEGDLMICGRCGHKIEEGHTVCLRCRLAFPKSSIYAKGADDPVVSGGRLHILVGALVLAVILAAVARFLARADWAGTGVLAVVGALVGGAAAGTHGVLSQWGRSVRCRYQLSRIEHRFNSKIDSIIKQAGERLEADAADADAHRNAGLAYLADGKFGRAVEHLQKAADAADSPRIVNHLAIAKYLSGDRNGAVADWRRISDGYAPSHFNLAVALMQKHEYGAALEELNLAKDADPDGAARRLPLYLGIIHFEQKRFAEAVREFEQAVSNSLDSGDARNNLGVALYMQGEVEKGIAEVAKARYAEPGHALIWANLGLAHFLQGEIPAAVRFLAHAKELDPLTGFIRTYYGSVLCAAGHHHAGVEQMQTATHMAYRDVESYLDLARTLIEDGEIERGAEELKQAMLLDANDADILACAGAAYLMRGRYCEAEQYLRKSMQHDPESIVAMSNLGQVYAENGHVHQAVPILEHTSRMKKRTAHALFNLAYALQLENRLPEAAEYYIAAIALDDSLTAAHYNLGLYFLSVEEWAGAVAEFQIVLKLQPDISCVNYPLGCAFQGRKDLPNAIKYWEMALEKEPKNIDLHVNLGLAYYLRDRVDQSIEHFQRVLRLRDGTFNDFNNLALAYTKKKVLDMAVRNFEKAIDMAPRNPVTHSNLGLAYYLNDQVEKSVVEWMRIASLDSSYARKRGKIETATYDDAEMSFAPIDWQRYLLKVPPAVPAARYRMRIAESRDPWWMDVGGDDFESILPIKQRMDSLRRAIHSMDHVETQHK